MHSEESDVWQNMNKIWVKQGWDLGEILSIYLFFEHIGLALGRPLCYNTKVAKLNTYVDSGDGAARHLTGIQGFSRQVRIS